MGAVIDFPRDRALRLAKAHGSDVFIETGTYRGLTARWAAGHFRRVHTIERSAELYHQVGDLPKNVMRWHGDSRTIIPRIVVDERQAFYWLDAHWDGTGQTSGASDCQCPLLDELSWLRGDSIILIDDARMFLSTPKPPFNPDAWPTFDQVLDCLPRGMFVQVEDDIIFAMPRELRSEWLKR